MTKARDLANLISGGFTEADIPNLSASKITSGTFADARISNSSVSQYASTFDDNKIINDISTLGLRVHTQENLNASNTNSASFDVFQDSSGITNLTNCARDNGEFVSSVVSANDTNTLEVFDADSLNTGDATGQVLIGARGDGKIVEAPNNNGQHVLDDNPFSGKSLSTGGWNSGDNSGFLIKDHTGSNASNFMNFGTGAFTIEGWFKLRNSSWDATHRYLFDFATANNTNRIAIALDGGSANNGVGTFNGTMGLGYVSSGLYWEAMNAGGTWKHVAWVRDSSGNTANFMGGNRYAASSSTNQTSVNYSTSEFNGLLQRHTSANNSSSYVAVANIRISNVARYNPTQSTYTVPTAKFTTNSDNTSATGSFEGNAITVSSTNKMGAVITYQDNAGTNTLNTDIVLKLSADNGSNYSTATLTALPDFATGIKMAKINDLSVTAGTQLKYKIEFANQASGSKEARIRGVSLQY